MNARRAFISSLVAMGLGVAVGRALPRETEAGARSTSPAVRPPAPPDRTCQAERAELTTVKTQLGICMAYARLQADPAPSPTGATAAPAAPAEPQTIEPLLAEMQKARAWRENAPELVFVKYRDGWVKAYPPEEWPPDGGVPEGARITLRKLRDGTWESYDPSPYVVQASGRPGPDGLVTLPDGTRMRYVFTDAGAP